MSQQQGFLWGRSGPSEYRTPLVGREDETRLLIDALGETEATRSARVVTVLGSAGVGKSRLAYEALLQGHAERGWRFPYRTYRGSARDTQAVYGLFARVLRARFGLLDGADPEAARAQMRAEVSAVLSDRKVGDVLYYLGQLIDLSFQDSPVTRALAEDPAQASRARRAVLRSFLEADAAQGPVTLVFEDVHEAASDTLDLLAFLIENLTGPFFILCVARNELLARYEDFPALAKGRHRVVELGPLGDADATLVAELMLAPAGDPPASLVDAACAVAGGNPMLLERMVRVFHDTGVLTDVGEPGALHWSVDLERLATVQLPLTVEDAVEARIAAITPPERNLLERAAAMGSVFWLGGLVAVVRRDAPAPDLWRGDKADDAEKLRQTLDDLVDRDYILRLPDSTFAGDVEYVFKHNKERERIARFTNPAEMRRWHHVLADWLEHKPQVRSHEEHMGRLARHCELAGRNSRAALAYLDAGDVAREQYAYQKAADYYAKGLTLLGDEHAGRRLWALHHYGDVAAHLGRTDDAFACFREMLTVAYRLDLLAKGGAAHNRIGRLYHDTGNLDQAERHLSAGLALFEGAGDERGVASSLDDLGKLHWLRGDYRHALEGLRRALAMQTELGDRRSISLSLNNLGLVLHDSGQFAEALDAFEKALTIRRDIGDLLGVVTTLNALGNVAQDQGDHARALDLFQEAHAVAREVGDKNRLAVVLTNIGESQYRLGNAAAAIRLLEQAEDLCDELGDKLGLAEAIRGLGKAYMMQNDLTKARACISRAVDLFSAVRSQVHLGVALRTLGEVTAAGGWGADHVRKARDYFLRAITIFEDLGNDVELARTCRAYAAFVAETPELLADDATRREAEIMRERADATFERVRRSTPP